MAKTDMNEFPVNIAATVNEAEIQPASSASC